MKLLFSLTLFLIIIAGCNDQSEDANSPNEANTKNSNINSNTDSGNVTEAASDKPGKSNHASTNQTFQASVKQAEDDILINVLDGEYRPSSSISTYQLMLDESEDAPLKEKLDEGTFVEVTYDGTFEQDDQPRIGVSEVIVIDAPMVEGRIDSVEHPIRIETFSGNFRPEADTTAYQVVSSDSNEMLPILDESGEDTSSEVRKGLQITFPYGGTVEQEDPTTIMTDRIDILDDPTFQARMVDVESSSPHIEILDGEFRPSEEQSLYRIVDHSPEDKPLVLDENQQEVGLNDLQNADIVDVTYDRGMEESDPPGIFVHEIKKIDKPTFQATIEQIGSDITISIPEDEYRPSNTSTYNLTGQEQDLVVFDETEEEIGLDKLEEGNTVDITYEGNFDPGNPPSIYAHKIEVLEKK
ncbi:hypothetical protein [Salsuginibacillus kocurii]|uniref:hypothetical protein n=1 Tax=Salsuginibacillus kocurii TaxID=427078 RepID=UPI00037107EF|nr:hypothetical protein [Salsuginibacillus kocurii]